MYTERTNRLNLFYTLEDKAKDSQLCNKDMLIFEGKHYTYAAVYDAVLRYGNWIRTNLGVKPKDVVAMDFQNSETFIFIWWALWSIGAKPAFINYNLTDQPLAHTLKTSTAKICLVDPNVVDSFTDDVRGLISGMKVVTFTKDLEVAAMAMEPVRAPDSDRSEDLAANMAILIYTSGTTGLPKPAIVSWGKLIVGGGFPARFNGYSINDVMYTVSKPPLLCLVGMPAH
jgi:acyl-CoA synthetase (AMP-forming)/AMP-acid ligase II